MIHKEFLSLFSLHFVKNIYIYYKHMYIYYFGLSSGHIEMKVSCRSEDSR